MNKIRENSCSFVAKNPRVRGSALIMAIVATTLLFIIGSLFLLSSRTYKQTTASADAYATEDAAVNAVIDRINTVLTEDLFGLTELPPRNMLNSNTTTNIDADEYWDYPYTNPAALGQNDDYWLADLEPQSMLLGSGAMAYYWRHISDIYLPVYGTQFGMPTITDPASNPYEIYYDNPAFHYEWAVDNIPANDYAPYWYSVQNADDGTIFSGGVYNLQFKPTVARIISDETPTTTYRDSGPVPGAPYIPYPWEWPWGGLADADGDGVADARWVKVPDVTSPDGKNVYTAVRIIDNCAMININTAYRNPDTAAMIVKGPWDGSRLSHVNLQGIISTTDAGNGLDATTIQAYRYGNVTLPPPPALDTYPNDTQYEQDVASRLLNPFVVNPGPPAQYYTPFEIMDELALRYRYFLNSPDPYQLGYRNDALLINLWQATFYPQSDPYRLYPYAPGDNLDKWFDNVTCTPTPAYFGWTPATPSIYDYNRRAISTVYSFDRVIIPKKANLGGGSFTIFDGATTDTMPGGFTAADVGTLAYEWNQWTNWQNTTPPLDWTERPVCVNDIGTANGPNIEQLAAAIWLALPQGSVLQNLPQFTGLGWTDNQVRERLACQMAANIVDYVDTDQDIQAFSPSIVGGGGAPGPDTFYGYEDNAEKLYISMVAIAQYDSDTSAAPTNENTYYAIELYNPGPGDTTIGNWILSIGGAPITWPVAVAASTVAARDSYIIADLAAAFPEADDTFAFSFTAGDEFRLEWAGAGAYPIDIIPSVSIPAFPDHEQAANGYDRFPAYRGKYIIGGTGTVCNFPIWTRNAVSWDGASDIATPLVKFNSGVATSISAIIQTTVRDSAALTVDEILQVFAIGTMDIVGTFYTKPVFWDNIRVASGGDITDISAGRLPKEYPNYFDIDDFVSIFNPSNDYEDPPANTIPIDNNGNRVFNEADELLIPGRININTAPWFVIAQLPWITDPAAPTADMYKLAHSIVAYRDKLNLTGTPYSFPAGAPNYTDRALGMGYLASPQPFINENPGLRSTSELLNVTQSILTPPAPDPWYDIRRFGSNTIDDNNAGQAPFYTTDVVTDDLLERDIIFQRISNLATVRSDTFTAYIAVRVGERGPIKRFIALFDRSNVFAPTDKPQLVALQPVPDPQ